MKEADKKNAQFDPAQNSASPAPAEGPVDIKEINTPPKQDENEGDFVAVGSGLGIDE